MKRFYSIDTPHHLRSKLDVLRRSDREHLNSKTKRILLTWVNCGPDWDNDTAKSPQTGEPKARMSRDIGVTRKLSNLHSDKIYSISCYSQVLMRS